MLDFACQPVLGESKGSPRLGALGRGSGSFHLLIARPPPGGGPISAPCLPAPGVIRGRIGEEDPPQPVLNSIQESGVPLAEGRGRGAFHPS